MSSFGTYIVTALQAEARPLISHFGLKQDTTCHALRVYRSDRITLVVSGTGKVKSAIATTGVLQPVAETSRAIVLNLGISGASNLKGDQACEIGDGFLVNRLFDYSSGRSYYPDMLARCECPEAMLTTVDRPLDSKDDISVPDGLVDMEGSGFFEAAATFCGPHQIALYKVVSDFLQVEKLDKEWVSDLISAHIPRLESICDSYQAIVHEEYDVLSDEDRNLLRRVRDNLRLTVSQFKILTESARFCKLESGNPLPDLSPYFTVSVSGKHEGKQHFERIRERLLAS
ncbi:MAG: hypothetical protein HOH43_10610 [Candidatus Latescibacteria bacterium]|nr:hypothetical protein [Candidatus Latescibacterota bacterium]